MDRIGTMTERVGANVRRLRRRQDISIRVLTERLAGLGWEISVQGFSRLETGQRGITVDQLAVLAEAFDVPMADLLEAGGPLVWADTRRAERKIEEIRRLTDDLAAMSS